MPRHSSSNLGWGSTGLMRSHSIGGPYDLDRGQDLHGCNEFFAQPVHSHSQGPHTYAHIHRSHTIPTVDQLSHRSLAQMDIRHHTQVPPLLGSSGLAHPFNHTRSQYPRDELPHRSFAQMDIRRHTQKPPLLQSCAQAYSYDHRQRSRDIDTLHSFPQPSQSHYGYAGTLHPAPPHINAYGTSWQDQTSARNANHSFSMPTGRVDHAAQQHSKGPRRSGSYPHGVPDPYDCTGGR